MRPAAGPCKRRGRAGRGRERARAVAAANANGAARRARGPVAMGRAGYFFAGRAPIFFASSSVMYCPCLVFPYHWVPGR